jgi:hypothetical protein
MLTEMLAVEGKPDPVSNALRRRNQRGSFQSVFGVSQAAMTRVSLAAYRSRHRRRPQSDF